MSGGGIVRGELEATLAVCLEPALEQAAGLLDAARTTLVVGAPTSVSWGRVAAAPRPLVAVAPDRDGPYGSALLARADAICVLHRDDLAGGRGRSAPVVVTGLPAAPAGAPRAAQVSRGRARLVHEHWLRDPDRRGWPEGVALVGGTGSCALAAAHCAWRDGRAVVALCDGPTPTELAGGAALIARAPLQAVEAVALLASAAPLRRAFVRRGRAVLDAAPGAGAVAERMLEATLAATGALA